MSESDFTIRIKSKVTRRVFTKTVVKINLSLIDTYFVSLREYFVTTEENKNYQYYVVEFIDPPYSDFGKYVCVPNSWMVLREVETQTSVVKYPVEEISLTSKRVKTKENFVNSWSVFKTNVKFGTDSYDKAMDYTKVLIQARSYSEIVTDGNGSSTSGLKPRVPQLIDSIVNKVVTPGTNDYSSTGTTSQQPATSNCNLANSNINSVDDRNSGDKTRFFTQLSHQSQLSNNRSLSSSLISLKQNNLEVKSVNRNGDKDNTAVDHVNSDLKFVETNRKFLFDHDFLVALKHTKSCLDIECKRVEHFVIDFKKYATKLQIMIGLIENVDNYCTDSLSQVINMSSTMFQRDDDREKVTNGFENIINVASVKTELKSEMEKNAGDNDDDYYFDKDDYDIDIDEDNDYYHRRYYRYFHSIKDKRKRKNQVKNCKKQIKSNEKDIVRKKRGTPRTFTYPPEYDKNDSRWTLRHRVYNKNLVQLRPHTYVYIDPIRLNNIKRLSKNSITLARLLLVEMFTESALRTCSLFGPQIHPFGDHIKIRPGLNAHALAVMLNYVQNYALNRKWVKYDRESVINSLQDKLRERRWKYGYID